jgi:hypothetical protein
MTIHVFLGVTAGALGLAANPLYVVAMVRGSTKPSKVTWWVLAALHLFLAASYYAAGARETIWLPVAYAISFLLVAVLSVRYGESGWRTTDTISLLGLSASGAAWCISRGPQMGLAIATCVEFFAIIPTIEKAYRRPSTEDRPAWLVATVAASLNVLAVDSWTPAIAAYPAYLLASNGLIAWLLIRPLTSAKT